MYRFSDKAPGEYVNRAAVFTDRLPPGILIKSCIVTVNVWEGSAGQDPNPQLFNLAPQINQVAFTTNNGRLVEIGQAIIQQINGGLAGVTYVLSFQATTSAAPAEILYEDVLQTVDEYVPPR